MYQFTEGLWAGNEASLIAFFRAQDKFAELQVEARMRGADPFELPPLMAVQDGVAVVNIHGPLVSGSAGFMRLFGLTGYADIQAGVQEAIEDRSAKAIMLHVASGGGVLEGVDETSEFITAAGRIKPVVTFAAGPMASAAYWIGSAGARRLASKTSVVGSIGVMGIHMDRSEMLKKDGIKPTVFRTGAWKGLGTPYEPLSKRAENEIQASIDKMGVLFEERVASNLSISASEVRERMGQGREFLGSEAVKVGLIHGVASAQTAFAAAKLLSRS